MNIDPNLTNVENARRLGVSEATVRRHRARQELPPSPAAHMAPAAYSTTEIYTDPYAPFQEIPTGAITSRGRSIRREDGSWEKITFNPNAVALEDARKTTYEDLAALLDNPLHHVPSPTPGAYRPYTPTAHVCLADFQVGKTDENGGTPELLARFQASLANLKRFLIDHQPEEVVLWELGDVLEGFSNTTQQRETNDIDLVTQIRTARRMLAEVIREVAPLAEKVILVSVPSNHGAVRTSLGNKNLASTPSNDYGIDINHALEEAFANRPEYAHVEFLRPEGLSLAVTYTCLDGTVVGGVHGDQASSADKVGDYWKAQSHGRRDNLHNADILLHGHHHNFSVRHSGDARWLIGAPALDNGSAWFSNRTGESSKSGILAFTSNEGQWEALEIL